MTEDIIRNPMRERPLAEIIDARYSRRDLLRHTGKLGVAAAVAGLLKPASVFAETARQTTAQSPVSSLTFTEISKNTSTTHAIAEGYDAHLLIRWGDRLTAEAPAFDPLHQTAAAQQQQFGFNNDFLAYMPFPQGSNSSTHGLLCANNEYATTYLMFPGLEDSDTLYQQTTREQVDVEMAAHGHSVVEVRLVGERWEPVIGSPYNRRITPYATDIALKGPAAGHPRLRTKEDPEGRTVRGTFGNCAGGVTPWGTVLVSEENFDGAFIGTMTDKAEKANAERYGLEAHSWYGWGRFYDRYDMGKEPHEANRFGWVVEYDPYDPARMPVKHTSLGRFKHETATTALAPDGRVVVYSGDDEKFEYIYRFVSSGKYNPHDRNANFGLLEDGTLYAAKFHEDGTLEWLPLVFGQGGLTPANGFGSQAEVLIETRRAADIMGATPMDRPEGIAVQPKTAQVFVSLTNNDLRTDAQVNVANTRATNIHGHIVEFQPQNGDHAGGSFRWRMFIQGGDPADKTVHALYQHAPSESGWLSCPDNLAIDPEGRLWICTDDQDKAIGKNDGLYACDTVGAATGLTRLFFCAPKGAEITGPAFTPDGTTLFLSIQHPGDGDTATFDDPATRWPDFRENMPPRPSVLAITKKDGGVIGS